MRLYSRELLPQLTISEAIRQRYQNTTRTLRELGRPLMLISVSNTKDYCNLTPDNFADILNSLKKNYTFGVCISYVKKDMEKAIVLSKKLEVKNITLETPDLSEFIVVLDAVDLCFTGEGGIGHMAAALNKPQLVLSSGTPLTQWIPLSSKAIVLEDATNVNNIDKNKILNAIKEIISMGSSNAALN